MNIRLVCRQANGEERKVILSATALATITEVAAQRLDCSDADVILQVKEGEDLWEIEESFWPSLSEGHTVYAHANFKRPKGTKRKASTSHSTSAFVLSTGAGGFMSDTATSARDEGGYNGPGSSSRRKSRSRAVQQSDRDTAMGDSQIHSASGSAPGGGISMPHTPSRSASSAARPANARSDQTSISPAEISIDQTPHLTDNERTRLRMPSTHSSHKKWDARADAMLWTRLRTMVEGRTQNFYTVAERMNIFKQILEEHGTHGTVTTVLAGRNAVALNARAAQKINTAVRMSLPLPDGLRELFVKPKNDGTGLLQSQSRAPSANRRSGRESGGESSNGETSNSTQGHRQRSRRSSFNVVDALTSQSDGDDEDSGSDSNNSIDLNEGPQQHVPTESVPRRNSPHTSRSIEASAFNRASVVNGNRSPYPGSHLFSAPPLPTFAGNAANHRRWSANSAPTCDHSSAPVAVRPRTAALPPLFTQANGGSQPPHVQVIRQTTTRGPYDDTAPAESFQMNGSAAASGSNTTRLRSRDNHTANHRRPEAGKTHTSGALSIERPLFLAEENARRTQAAQAAVNPFLASLRGPRESFSGEGQPNIHNDETEVQMLVTRDTVGGQTAASTFASQAVASRPELTSSALKGEEEIDELEEEVGNAEEDVSTRRNQGVPPRAMAREAAQPLSPPFQVARDASPADIAILQMALSADWNAVRIPARSIVRSSIPRKQTLNVCDIDFDGAAAKLASLMSPRLVSSQPLQTTMFGQPLTSQRIDGFYSGLAVSIALEVFGSTPQEWSVRRTSFAVAGYFAALSKLMRSPSSGAGRRGEEGVAPANPANAFSFSRFASLSQKLFWAIPCAKDGSRCLEAEGEDISAALALVLGSASQLGRHLADRLRSRPREEMLPLAVRCKSYVDRLEASIKFVQRCPEAREWGAEQQISPRMIPSRANIRHWLLPDKDRFLEARQALLDLQNARDVLESNGMYTEPTKSSPTMISGQQHSGAAVLPPSGALPPPPPPLVANPLPQLSLTESVQLIKRE